MMATGAGAMMQNKVYETVPSSHASNNIPTLLGNDGNGTGDHFNDHPVGLNAAISCGGNYNWDCTIVNGAVPWPLGSKNEHFCYRQLRFVRSPSGVQRSTDCYVHDLPQPVRDERV